MGEGGWIVVGAVLALAAGIVTEKVHDWFAANRQKEVAYQSLLIDIYTKIPHLVFEVQRLRLIEVVAPPELDNAAAKSRATTYGSIGYHFSVAVYSLRYHADSCDDQKLHDDVEEFIKTCHKVDVPGKGDWRDTAMLPEMARKIAEYCVERRRTLMKPPSIDGRVWRRVRRPFRRSSSR